MYCIYCGNKNAKDAKFCQKCGKRVDDGYPSNESSQKSIYTPKTSESYLAGIIRAKSIRRLYLGCFLIVVAIVIFLSESNYISNLISGPRWLDASTLENEMLNKDVKDLNVKIQLVPDSVYPAGYTHITQSINETTKAVESETTDSQYYLTFLGKHIVVLEGIPKTLPTGTFSGVVEPLYTNLQDKLIADFNKDPKLAKLTTLILPYQISSKGITSIDQFWTFMVGVGLLIWGGVVVIRRISDLDDKQHYIYKIATTAGYSNIDDLSNDFVNIKDSAEPHEQSKKIRGFFLNSKFLFADDFSSYTVYPLSQMYWAYKKIIRNSVYFIPTGKSYEIIMHFKPNQTVTVKESEENVNQYLFLIAQFCPTAKFGYTR